MKILVAIYSDNRAGILAKKTLSWAPRGGYSIRIFIPDEKQLEKYKKAIDEVNYQHYLDAQYQMIIVGRTPLEYARAEGFDLLLTLPDNMKGWNKTRNKDLMVIEYAEDVGRARVDFGTGKVEKRKRFINGAEMWRVE